MNTIENKLNVNKPAPLLHLVPYVREKKPERKRKNLIRLGVDQDHAYAWKGRALRKCLFRHF
ncbi:hypothetical protein [Algoriphagus sp.]|uniref:hypothetical protein n=1 Tax=Algoriphagus sp. TaxID=1872435 RepID=UPI00391DBBC0